MVSFFYCLPSIFNLIISWKDGKAFLALIQKACPNAFSYEEEVSETDAISNMKKAFEIAEKELGLPSDMLDPQDIINSNPPDEKSIMTYVSLLVPYIENVRAFIFKTQEN